MNILSFRHENLEIKQTFRPFRSIHFFKAFDELSKKAKTNFPANQQVDFFLQKGKEKHLIGWMVLDEKGYCSIFSHSQADPLLPTL
jgi:hypothetical protein